MGFFKKRKKNLKKVGRFLQGMIGPVILSLLPIIDGMIETWKLCLVKEIRNVDPEKLVGYIADSVDELREGIKTAIKKGIGLR